MIDNFELHVCSQWRSLREIWNWPWEIHNFL